LSYITLNLDVRIEEHPNIFEKDISEHLHVADINYRVNDFVRDLMERPERCIVVVGHSAFFREMLQTECKMKNCEVRECYLTSDGAIENMRTVIEGGDALLEEPGGSSG
jgi:broad specificity phosphatase PhoE